MQSGGTGCMLRTMDNRTYSLTGELDALDCHAFATFARLAAEADAPMKDIVLRPNGDGTWRYELRSAWQDRAHDARNIAWTRAAIAEVFESRTDREAA
jgi:hypothetical protein